MPKVNKTKYALLGLLSIRPMSGYDIKKFIETSISYFWNESYGQIYPILKQLVREDLATRHVEHQESRPDRKVYTITDQGLEVLRGWLEESPEQPPPRDELVLKVFFGYHQAPRFTSSHLQEELTQLREVLGYLDHVTADLKERLEGQSRLPYLLSCVDLGRRTLGARAEWCADTLEMLEQLEEDYEPDEDEDAEAS